MKQDNLILFGKIIKPHGVKGEVRIDLNKPLAHENECESVFIDLDGKLVPFFVQSISDKGPFAICKFEGVDNYDQASSLKSKSIFEQSGEEEIPNDASELQLLIGYAVQDMEYGALGNVTGIEDGPQSRLVIHRNDQEILIPYVEEIILSIDAESRKINVDLPAGFLDIYE